MSTKLGWQSGLAFAVMIFVLTVVVRFLFGAHTLAQAGTEAAVFGLFSSAVYAFGYYDSKRVYCDGGLLSVVFGSGITMFVLGCVMHGVYAFSFTSTFFLLVYSFLTMWMAWLGYEDQAVEARHLSWAANGML